jgi:hypothetical protein
VFRFCSVLSKEDCGLPGSRGDVVTLIHVCATSLHLLLTTFSMAELMYSHSSCNVEERTTLQLRNCRKRFFWDVTPCSLAEVQQRSVCRLLLAGFLLSLLFYPEDGVIKLLRNVGRLLPDYMGSHPWREYVHNHRCENLTPNTN